jgi:hypothetical protein
MSVAGQPKMALPSRIEWEEFSDDENVPGRVAASELLPGL